MRSYADGTPAPDSEWIDATVQTKIGLIEWGFRIPVGGLYVVTVRLLDETTGFTIESTQHDVLVKA